MGRGTNVTAACSGQARLRHLRDMSHSTGPGIEVTKSWVLIPALPLVSCESFIKPLTLSGLQILHL